MHRMYKSESEAMEIIERCYTLAVDLSNDNFAWAMIHAARKNAVAWLASEYFMPPNVYDAVANWNGKNGIFSHEN